MVHYCYARRKGFSTSKRLLQGARNRSVQRIPPSNSGKIHARVAFQKHQTTQANCLRGDEQEAGHAPGHKVCRRSAQRARDLQGGACARPPRQPISYLTQAPGEYPLGACLFSWRQPVVSRSPAMIVASCLPCLPGAIIVESATCAHTQSRLLLALPLTNRAISQQLAHFWRRRRMLCQQWRGAWRLEKRWLGGCSAAVRRSRMRAGRGGR